MIIGTTGFASIVSALLSGRHPFPLPLSFSLSPSFFFSITFLLFSSLSLFSLSFFTVVIVLDILPVFVPLLVWKLKLYKHVHTYMCNILVFYTNICDYIVLHAYYTHKHLCLYLHKKILVYVESMGIFIIFKITFILLPLLKDIVAEYRILG